MKVLLLLSTYNGEKYLVEQVESILEQMYVEVTILIRDDGSTDGTTGRIKELQKKHANIILEEGDNCGSAGSFIKLLNIANSSHTDFDYYAFCDQDDVWMKDKLDSAITVLDQQNQSRPLLYMGAYQMVDAELRPIPTQLVAPKLNLPAALAANSATGCTMLFNKCLLELLASKRPKDIIMHDYWAYLVCLAVGGYVYYDKIPHILYRQHGNNVIGGKKDPFIKKWYVRISKLFKKGDSFKSKLAAQLLDCYSTQMSKENVEFLSYAATCKKFSSKIRLLANPNFRGKTLDNNIQNFGLVLTGKF